MILSNKGKKTGRFVFYLMPKSMCTSRASTDIGNLSPKSVFPPTGTIDASWLNPKLVFPL